jgi:hypothetical protein
MGKTGAFLKTIDILKKDIETEIVELPPMEVNVIPNSLYSTMTYVTKYKSFGELEKFNSFSAFGITQWTKTRTVEVKKAMKTWYFFFLLLRMVVSQRWNEKLKQESQRQRGCRERESETEIKRGSVYQGGCGAKKEVP